jgi:hypothetical protein
MADQANLLHAQAEALIEQINPDAFKLDTMAKTDDKKMLLALQCIVRAQQTTYVYVEVGSYMGGTLVPHLMDTRCRRVVSIDKRPGAQADERGGTMSYFHASTALMLERLAANLPASALTKLETHDCDAADLPETARTPKFDLAFIDGEHTNRAAFQDFLSLLPSAQPNCIIAFHDANLVTDAILNVQSLLRHQGIAHESRFLPEVVFALFLGSYTSCAPAFDRFALDPETFLQNSKQQLWGEISRLHARAA